MKLLLIKNRLYTEDLNLLPINRKSILLRDVTFNIANNHGWAIVGMQQGVTVTHPVVRGTWTGETGGHMLRSQGLTPNLSRKAARTESLMFDAHKGFRFYRLHNEMHPVVAAKRVLLTSSYDHGVGDLSFEVGNVYRPTYASADALDGGLS